MTVTPAVLRALAWLLVPVLAFRALTALHLDLRGPLHFHLDEHHAEQSAGHGHSHGHAERHHHAAGDPAVVTLEDHDRDVLAHEEEEAPGWSATMCVAAAPARAWPDPSPGARAIAPADDAPFRTRSPGAAERPPQPASA